MSAKKGARYGSREELFELLRKGNDALRMVGEENRLSLLPEFAKAIEAFKNGIPFEVSILRLRDFGQFLALPSPTQGMFNQLSSEVSWWDLLDQIEQTCFLQSASLEKARPFIGSLWENEVVSGPDKPPAGWGYLPPEEAVGRYRRLLSEKNLKADSTLALAKQAKPRPESEGVSVWPKLSILAKIFGVSGNPLENTEEGWEAYVRILNPFVALVGQAHIKVYPQFSFKDWFEGQLTADRVRLTPAGRRTWQKLEQASEDDFVIAPFGANTGSLHAGYSVRRSRLRIVLAGSQFPQDAIMVGATIATQCERLTEDEHLKIDCPGTKFDPAADGQFYDSFWFDWSEGGLHFGRWTSGRWGASRAYGSASGFLE